jgi:hypothetical protein
VRRDAGADDLEHLLGAPAGLLVHQAGLVVVGEQVGGALHQAADRLAVHVRQLLGGVGGERDAPLTAAGRVAQHRVRVVRGDDDEVHLAHAGDVDVRGLAMAPGKKVAICAWSRSVVQVKRALARVSLTRTCVVSTPWSCSQPR